MNELLFLKTHSDNTKLLEWVNQLRFKVQHYCVGMPPSIKETIDHIEDEILKSLMIKKELLNNAVSKRFPKESKTTTG